MNHLFFYLFLCNLFTVFNCIAQMQEILPIDSISNWEGDSQYFNFQNDKLISNGPDSISSISIYQNFNLPVNNAWEIEISFGFSPSPSNFSKIYLITDNPPGSDSLNGYYLQVGGISGNNDAIDLYYQKGYEHSKIISGNAGMASRENTSLKIKIELWQNQYWNLYADSTNTENYLFQGSTIHDNLINSGYTGLEFVYTSTRKDKFVIDKFRVGQSQTGIQNIEVINDSLLLVILPSTAINTIDISDISVNQNIPKKTHLYSDSLLCILDQSLNRGKNSIYINNVTVAPILFEFYPTYLAGSILINEILFDPEPSAGLPDYEFIELYNQNKFSVQVQGFCVSDKTSMTCIKDTFSMQAESYLILCPPESKFQYDEFGNALSLDPWPTLNNSGDDLRLISNSGIILHKVSYSESWHDSPYPADGYSLEMIMPEYWCLDNENWATSAAQTGGTPGRKNAVFSGDYFPEALKIIDLEYTRNRLKVVFNRNIFKIESWPFKIDNDPIPGFRISNDSLFIEFPYLLKINQKYLIDLSGIEDCLGQVLPNPNLEIIVPGDSKRGDLIINEVLFNPGHSGTDFIELFNNSENYLELKNFIVSFQGLEQNQPTSFQVSENSRIILPGGYLVLTGDTFKLYTRHPNTIKRNTLQVKRFPNLTNQGGNLKLTLNDRIMETCFYSPDFHNPLLLDQEEVSLERIFPDALATNKENWTSASTNSGYATPGYANSQLSQKLNKEDIIIDPKIFSPNGDGENDQVFVKYQLPGPGWMAKVNIFDKKGRLIKTLNSLTISGTRGYFSWNGQKEDGSIAPMGIYIALIEFFSLEGETRKFRETITIGGKI